MGGPRGGNYGSLSAPWRHSAEPLGWPSRLGVMMKGFFSKVKKVLTVLTDLLLVGRNRGWWDKEDRPYNDDEERRRGGGYR